MKYSKALKQSLLEHLGKERLVFMPRWWTIRNGTDWRGKTKKPLAIVLHHTAGASTESTNPKNKGNLKGANAGVINYIQNHFRVPAANFTLDRDGSIYVHNAYPVWHAGLGSFKGKKPWSSLQIPDNLGNNYMLGVEIMSKGRKKDFTEAQIDSLVLLLKACRDASGWRNISLVYRPRHRDWAGRRKPDILYTNAEVTQWIKERK